MLIRDEDDPAHMGVFINQNTMGPFAETILERHRLQRVGDVVDVSMGTVNANTRWQFTGSEWEIVT